MIGLAHPVVLALLVPWLVLVVAVARAQHAAFGWIEQWVDERFRPAASRTTRRGLTWHLLGLALAGGLLIVAAAGPYRLAQGERPPGGSVVVLLLDASLSMGADDSMTTHTTTTAADNDQPDGGSGESAQRYESRFDEAKGFCLELLDAVPDIRWAMVSFSGSSVVHSPPTSDLEALRTLLHTQRFHIYAQSMGSRFSAGFEAVFHLMDGRDERFQVVLLSDGELPEGDDYNDDLAAFEQLGVPVHTVAIGSREWQHMSVYVLEDIIARAEEPRTAAKYRTRREDRELRRIARRTGGHFLVTERGAWVDDLRSTMQRRARAISVAGETGGGPPVRQDLSWLLVASFGVALLVHTLVLQRRPPAPRLPPVWLGRATLGLVLAVACLASSACDQPTWWRAHRLNEQGIARFRQRELDAAATRFEQSAAFRVREQIPIYNLAGTAYAEGDDSRAHSLYERALERAPRLAEAHYNDGHALVRWGESEIDLASCRFERTRVLWQQALERFETAAGLASGRLARQARDNAAAVRELLAELERLEQDCQASASSAAVAAGGDGGGDGGSAGGGGGGGGQTPPEPPPLSGDERAQLAEELARVRRQASGATGYRQSRATQLTPEAAEEAAGRPIRW